MRVSPPRPLGGYNEKQTQRGAEPSSSLRLRASAVLSVPFAFTFFLLPLAFAAAPLAPAAAFDPCPPGF